MDQKNGKLRNIFFIGTFLVLLLSNIFQFLGVFANTSAWKNKVDMTLNNHKNRIINMEESIVISRNLLFEIRYNLKTHILHQDGADAYIENPK